MMVSKVDQLVNLITKATRKTVTDFKHAQLIHCFDSLNFFYLMASTHWQWPSAGIDLWEDETHVNWILIVPLESCYIIQSPANPKVVSVKWMCDPEEDQQNWQVESLVHEEE
jgi:hypothetical protein